jgi:hypothetical protein
MVHLKLKPILFIFAIIYYLDNLRICLVKDQVQNKAVRQRVCNPVFRHNSQT